MASQVQLTNTFNEFRQAYNDAANDIGTLTTDLSGANAAFSALNTSLTNGTANVTANNLQLAQLTTSGSRVVFGVAPVTGSGAVLDDSDGFIYHSANSSIVVAGAATVGSLTSGATITSTGNFISGANKAFIVAANGTFISPTGNIELNNTSSSVNAYHMHATLHVAAGGDVESWAAGKGQVATSHHIAAIGNQDEAVDMVVTNSSDGANAYAEFIAVNDTGDIENGWASFGVNSSQYGEGAYAVTKQNDAYILYQAPTDCPDAGDLVIGTGGNGTLNRIIFSANGFDDPANNTQMTIHPGQKVSIQIDTESSNTSTGALVVSGGIGLNGNLNVGGNVAITGTITLGGGGNTVSTSSLTVESPIVFVGQNNAADTFDLGFVGIYNDGTEKYTGFARDASDNGMYKLFSNTAILPANTVDFTDPNLTYGALTLGEVKVVDTTTSSSTTTGAAIISGGIGVAENAYIGGLVRATSTETSTSTSTGAIVVSGGVGVAGNTHIGGDLVVGGSASFTGGLRAQELIEDVIDSSVSTNEFTLDYTTGNIFYGTGSLTGDFLAKLTNVPTTNGRATTISLFVPQDATARRPIANTIQLNGTNVAISWVGGNSAVEVTASKLDIFNFTVLRRSDTFTVLGTVTGNTATYSI